MCERKEGILTEFHYFSDFFFFRRLFCFWIRSKIIVNSRIVHMQLERQRKGIRNLIMITKNYSTHIKMTHKIN